MASTPVSAPDVDVLDEEYLHHVGRGNDLLARGDHDGAVAALMRAERISAGTTVFREHDPGGTLYIISRGQVALSGRLAEMTAGSGYVVSAAGAVCAITAMGSAARAAAKSFLKAICRASGCRLARVRPGQTATGSPDG